MDLIKEIERVEEILKLDDIEWLNNPIWKKEVFDELLQSPIFRVSYPEKLLNKKFTELLKPFIFNHGEKIIYCKQSRRIDTDNDSAQKSPYIFSALTPEMINADREYFDNTKSSDGYSVLDMLYKPYLYEMFVDEDEEIEVDSEAWYKVTVSKPKSADDNNKIKGHLAYGASPFRFKEILIDWKNKVKLNDPLGYKLEQGKIVSAQKSEIQAAMDKLFDNVSQRKLKVHRVGQANCIRGWNTTNGIEREFEFDLGFPIDIFLKFKINTTELDRKATGILDDVVIMEEMKPELVIISHWHQDHYKAAYTLRRDVYIGKDAATWIAPLYKVVDYDQSANRLVSYLIKTGKILFVPENYGEYVKGNCRLCRGTGSNLNNSGLMLQMNSTLLPGDCDYDNWPSNYGMDPTASNLTSNIENIIVPHHAAKTDKSSAEPKLKKIFNGNKKKKAIICVGNNNYGHPEEKTVKIYADLGFKEILKTNDDQCKITDFLIRDK